MNKKYSYEYKTKSSVPSFLLKTYEMLEVKRKEKKKSEYAIKIT